MCCPHRKKRGGGGSEHSKGVPSTQRGEVGGGGALEHSKGVRSTQRAMVVGGGEALEHSKGVRSTQRAMAVGGGGGIRTQQGCAVHTESNGGGRGALEHSKGMLSTQRGEGWGGIRTQQGVLSTQRGEAGPTLLSAAQKGKGPVPERLGPPAGGADVIAGDVTVGVVGHHQGLSAQRRPRSRSCNGRPSSDYTQSQLSHLYFVLLLLDLNA